jgi:type VI secretion system secreted protein Hcp
MDVRGPSGFSEHPLVPAACSPRIAGTGCRDAATAPTRRTGHRRAVAAAVILLASVLGGIGPAWGQTNLVMRIDGIPGESRVPNHVGWIDVSSVGYGGSYSVTGSERGKATVQDLQVVKFVDKATPLLFGKMLRGQLIPTVRIEFIADGTQPKTFYAIDLEEVLISSLSAAASQAPNRPSEALTLNFARITVSYQECDANGVPQGAPITFSWDVAQNR